MGKACCARHYFYSRLENREALIALGSHQGGVLNFCVRSIVAHCRRRRRKKKKKKRKKKKNKNKNKNKID